MRLKYIKDMWTRTMIFSLPGTKAIPRSLVLLEVGFLKYYPCKFTVSRQLPCKLRKNKIQRCFDLSEGAVCLHVLQQPLRKSSICNTDKTQLAGNSKFPEKIDYTLLKKSAVFRIIG